MMHNNKSYLLNFDKFLIFFILVIYPLFIRVKIYNINVQYLLNSVLLLSIFIYFIHGKAVINKVSACILPFILCAIFVILRGLGNDFQAGNNDLIVQPFFAINVDGDLASNYYNIGDYRINLSYMLRMIVFIPLALILGCSIKAINFSFVRKSIWITTIIILLSLIYDFVVGQATRLSGIYSNPQDLSAYILFQAVIFYHFRAVKNKFEITLFLVICLLCIYLTGTRSSLLIFIVIFTFRKKASYLLFISVVVSFFVAFIIPAYVKYIAIIDFTSTSSSLIRFRLWADYLIPHIQNNFLLGVGTVPIVTESLLIFLFFVYGFVGFCSFSFYIFSACYLSKINKGIITLLFCTIILQSIYFMGLLSVDNIAMTFFWLGYLSRHPKIK